MTELREPYFDHTTNTWYVEDVDIRTGRVVSVYDFYDESDARQFYYEAAIRTEFVNGL